MADNTETSLLVIQTSNQGTDEAAASVKALGTSVDKTSQSVGSMNASTAQQQAALSSWSSSLNTASTHLDGISQKLDLTSRAAGATGLAFDSIGWDPAAAGADQLSGRLQEVATGFDALSQVAGLASSAIGTHGDAVTQATDQYQQLSAAQDDSADSTDLSTAAWIAAGVAAVALVGVGAGLVVGLGAISDGMTAVAGATEKWAEELLTGGILDNMQALIDSGQQLNDLSATTGIAAQNFSTLATGLQGSGLSADTLKTMMTGLATTLTSTSDSAVKARTAMAEMGIDVETLGKNGNDVQAVFLAITNVLSGYQDGAQKTALAQQLLGASSAEAINGIDSANAAYARMDEQTRTNIANTAAFTAEIQQQIATFKDLRDNTPATVGQSQISSGTARVGAGAQQIGAAGFGGLFSSAGRTEIGAGFSNIGGGLSNLDSDIQLQAAQAEEAVGAAIDKVFGTGIAKAVQDHIDDITTDINATAARAATDMRSTPPPPAEGSAAWASSGGTAIVAQYDTGTAALVTFTNAYSKLEDARKQKLITDDQETAAVGKLAAAYADAIDPFGKYLSQQQDLLKVKQQFPAGPERDMEVTVAQDKTKFGSSYDEGQDRSLIQGQQALSASDQASAAAKQQAQALAELHTSNMQEAADSTAVAAAWGESTQAGLLAETQTQALAAARAIDKTAAADQADVVAKLTSSYADALKGGSQYIDQLKQQADAAAAAAAAAGSDPETQAQAAITAQVQQQFALELAKAQVLDAQLGTDTNTLAVMQQQTTAAALLANIHDSQIQQSLKNELASTGQALTDEQALFDLGGKKLATSKEEAAVQQEIANLRAKGVTDLTSEMVQQDLMNVRETQALKDQADAQDKAAADVTRQIGNVSNQIERTFSTDVYDVLTGKAPNFWATITDLGAHAFADLTAKIAEQAIIIPVITDVVGTIGSAVTGSAASSVTSSAGSSLTSLLGSAGTSAGGSVAASSVLGGSGTGLLSGAGSYLFGSAGTATQLSGEIATAPTAAEELGAIGTTTGSTSGLIGSGGTIFGSGLSAGSATGYGAAIIANILATSYLGSQVGKSAGSPVAGGLESIAADQIFMPFVDPITALISGILGGQKPSVGPNSGGYVNNVNGVETAGITGADNGGSVATAQAMQAATIAALNSVTTSVAGIANIPTIRVGSFGGKYFETTDGSGGSPQNATYSNEGDAVANAVLMALKGSDLSKVDPNVATAVGNIAQGSDEATISSDLTFATQFSAAIAAMKSGVTDYTQAAEVAAETTSAQLVTSIQAFNTQTAALGLSTADATAAEKAAVENFLGLTTAQPISALEQSIDTVYGKLEGVAGLLSTVGIDQATATEKVKEQVEAMAGITTAIPDNAIADEVASVKQTFADLGTTFQALGITADQVAQGLQANIDAIQASVQADLTSRNNSAQGLDILNTLATAIAQHTTDLQNAAAAGLGTSGSGLANDVFNNTVFAALNQLAGNTTALDAVINQYAGDTSDAGQLIEAAAEQVKGLGAVAGTTTISVSSLQSAFSTAQSAYISALNTQISATQSLISAMQGLTQTANNNLLGDNSDLSPQGKLSAAQSTYQTDLAQLQSGTLTGSDLAAALQNFGTDATGYEGAARNYYGSSADYASIFNSVQGSLTSLGSGTGYGSAENSLAGLQSELASAQGLGATDPASSDLAALKTAMLTAFNTLQTAVGGTTVAVSGVDSRIQSANQISGSIATSASQTASSTGSTASNTSGTTSAVSGVSSAMTQSGTLGQLIYSQTNIQYAQLTAISTQIALLGTWTDKIVNNTGQTAAKLGGTPMYGSGTLDAPGGLSVVGERGTELMNIPKGGQVYNRQQLAGIFSGGSGANDNGASLDALNGIRSDNRYAYAAFVRGQQEQSQLLAQMVSEMQALRSEMSRMRSRSLVA